MQNLFRLLLIGFTFVALNVGVVEAQMNSGSSMQGGNSMMNSGSSMQGGNSMR